MRRTAPTLAATLLFACAAAAIAQSNPGAGADPTATARPENCDGLKDNARDICKAEADARRRIGEAEAKVQGRDSPKHQYELAEVKAKAQYEVDRQRCDDLVGNAKDLCQREAKAIRDLSLVQAEKRTLQAESGVGRPVEPAAAAGLPADTPPTPPAVTNGTSPTAPVTR